MTDQEHATTFEFSKITDSLFLGTNLCCQSHFSEQLLSLGITVDISLEEEHIDAPFGVESYLWLPVKDHAPPTEDQLQTGISFGKTVDDAIALISEKRPAIHLEPSQITALNRLAETLYAHQKTD